MAKQERDPHTGRMTTGHEWNGIKELSTPIPRLVWMFLIATLICSLIMWVLLPAIPTGKSYTKGLLGADETQSLAVNLIAAQKRREDWVQHIEVTDFSVLAADPKMSTYVEKTGKRLFLDNCAMCHGATGQGGINFPNLTDDQWLWGGAPEQIMETLRVGINHIHEDTRYSVMQAYGRDELLSRDDINNLVVYIQSLSHAALKADETKQTGLAAGAALFQANCSFCHGEDAKGMTSVGAPNLTDDFWLYGGDKTSIYQTLQNGRQGVMPSWDKRLTLAERKLLTLYILKLEAAVNEK